MGGGTIFKAVTKRDMEDIAVLLPEQNFLNRFEEISRPMEQQIENLMKRNSVLRKTRDLLPKLISGELDLSEMDIRLKEDI